MNKENIGFSILGENKSTEELKAILLSSKEFMLKKQKEINELKHQIVQLEGKLMPIRQIYNETDRKLFEEMQASQQKKKAPAPRLTPAEVKSLLTLVRKITTGKETE